MKYQYAGRPYVWRQVLSHLGLLGSFKERSSGTFVGCCVFHKEKNPSLHLYPDSMKYYCYGCGAHGTVTDFVSQFKKYNEYIPEDMQELQDFFKQIT